MAAVKAEMHLYTVVYFNISFICILGTSVPTVLKQVIKLLKSVGPPLSKLAVFVRRVTVDGMSPADGLMLDP